MRVLQVACRQDGAGEKVGVGCQGGAELGTSDRSGQNGREEVKKCSKCGELYPGKQCRLCHNAANRRYRATEHGREKVRATSRKWKKENPEKVDARNARWRARHREEERIRNAEYFKNHPEEMREKNIKWHADHPDYRRIQNQNRNALRKANGGVISKDIVQRLFELQKGKCPCCKQPLGKDYELDHRMPLALGGANCDENMQLLRGTCNRKKSAKHPVDFMQSRGFLL